jgi:chromodomain-helicase-DNA-binding protein 7
LFTQLEDEPFNPDYVEVDRVLDLVEQVDPATNKTIKHYLVKWRSLPYEDSTWELEEDIDPCKIQQYERFNKIPPKDQWKVSFAKKSTKCTKRKPSLHVMT